jgi:tetratricopeptide (TPR) repeat protein
MYQGKFDEALEVFDDGIGADRMERVEGIWCAEKYFARAAILQLKKDLGKALEDFERGLEIWSQVVVYRTDYFQPFYADLLVDSGDISGAEEVGRSLRGHLDEMDKSQRYLYWLVLGNNERAKGNPEGAIAHLETAVGEAAVHLFYVRFCLASAYLEAGRVGEAVDRLEDLIGRYPDPRANYPILSVRCHYLLGLAYEKSGWTRKAIEQYEEFLTIWKDADPGIPEVEDARERIALLKASSS